MTTALLAAVLVVIALGAAITLFLRRRRRAVRSQGPAVGANPAAGTPATSGMTVGPSPVAGTTVGKRRTTAVGIGGVPTPKGLGPQVHGPGQPADAAVTPSVGPASSPALDPLWRSPQTDAEPELAERLGGGAQGDIHAIEGDNTRVFKRLATPALGARAAFDRLVMIGPSMQSALRGAGVELVWPEAAAYEGNAVTGYTMPRLPAGYVVRVNGKELESALMYAVPKEGLFRPDSMPDAQQRVALITGIARFLDALHRHDYVYGDISWSNILFRLDPEPTVLVFDIDGVRAVGHRPVLSASALDTIDFTDDAAGPNQVAGFDSDRFKFALLVYRMLVDLSISGQLPGRVALGDDLGLSPALAHRLQRLLMRAAGPPGTRPTIREWLDALEARS